MVEYVRPTMMGRLALKKIRQLEEAKSFQEEIDDQWKGIVSRLDESYSKGIATVRGRRNRDAFSRAYFEFAHILLSSIPNLENAVGYEGAVEVLKIALSDYAQKFRD